MKRGELWWAELPPPIGTRPVLLLSRDSAYAVRAYVTIGVVTSRIREIPAEVVLDRRDGMRKRCVVNLDSIATIPKAALTRRIKPLSKEKIRAVDRAIHFALGLSH